jgi:hypothetical protein
MPDDYLILSSTGKLTEDLIDALKAQSAKPLAETNSLVELDGVQLASILKANRENLIRQNMVEEGNSREEAETQIDLILTVLEQLDKVKLDVGIRGEKTRAELRIELDLSE